MGVITVYHSQAAKSDIASEQMCGLAVEVAPRAVRSGVADSKAQVPTPHPREPQRHISTMSGLALKDLRPMTLLTPSIDHTRRLGGV